MLTSHGTDTTRQWNLIVANISRVVLSAINKSLISFFPPWYLLSGFRQESLRSLQALSMYALKLTEILGSVIRLADKTGLSGEQTCTSYR